MMWKKYCRTGQAADGNKHGACAWITKATDTHSEYVILAAFPLQH